MKTVFFLLFLFTIVSCSPDADSSLDVDRVLFDESYLKGNKNNPFICVEGNRAYTGVLIQLHPNGELAGEFYVKEGRRDGLQRTWYKNGQLWSECSFSNGKKNGLYRQWYETGELKSEVLIINGSIEESKFWDKSGVELDESEYWKTL